MTELNCDSHNNGDNEGDRRRKGRADKALRTEVAAAATTMKIMKKHEKLMTNKVGSH